MTEVLLLTLLYAVAATAIIGAINARDTVRMVVSSLFAMFCLATAVFHTSRYMTLKEVVVPPPPPPPPPEAPKPPPPPDTAGLGASKKEALIAQGKNELRQVLIMAKRLQQNLSGFDLSRVADVSDDEYQRMQGQAQGFAAQAAKLKEGCDETISKLPAGVEDAAEALSTGVESLVSASRNLERYFKSENDTEERDRMASFRRGAQAADAALRKAEIRIGAGT